jgi:hypothetical protein
VKDVSGTMLYQVCDLQCCTSHCQVQTSFELFEWVQVVRVVREFEWVTGKVLRTEFSCPMVYRVLCLRSCTRFLLVPFEPVMRRPDLYGHLILAMVCPYSSWLGRGSSRALSRRVGDDNTMRANIHTIRAEPEETRVKCTVSR